MPLSPLLEFVFDPFNIARDDASGASSANPFLVVDLSFPYSQRYSLGTGCHLASLVKCPQPGPDWKGKRDVTNFVLEIMVDELHYLYHQGFQIPAEVSGGAPISYFAQLVLVLSDFRGLLF